MIKIYIPDVKNGVLDTQFGNGNLGKKYPNSVSFPIKWDKVKGAKSYALTLIDYEATAELGFVFIHWVAANIKKNKLKWDDSFSRQDKMYQFENSMTRHANNYLLDSFYRPHPDGVYFGPLPPAQDHNYRLEVFALDVENIIPEDLKNKSLFYDDFLDLIKNHVIDFGITSFLYRSHGKVENNLLVKKQISKSELNAPLPKEQENFFLDFLPINFSSSALIARENDYHLLDIEFLGKQGASPFFSARNFDIEIYSDSDKIKEYVIMVTSFAENFSLGVGLNVWNRVGIIKQTNEYKTILSAGKNSFDLFDSEIPVYNSFGSFCADSIAKKINLDSSEKFEFIKAKYGVIYLPGLTNGQGKYQLEIFGIDQVIDWSQIARNLTKPLTSFEVLSAIKGKVVGYNRTFFKLI
ncbi:YbhB/YbcL family Raf kinase inhibitor-like protein [Mesomycoplasma ovipneumoniae]|uniref:YbhB/YbcL family Raf kinase inhibitor-like protein n=1 Tax=Mesomycoplasma ovipneumoniae TaxID=29562 RepID=A0AAP6CTB1_9BACT|nr:YbhB/YbcL family Raf kinase inhibitor-like protein [Mesomycoplasma ovipneumoniae]MDW2852378.1 YbhB/YbcL family Raf kinase inhibitor-like protein [Mesomycoplasma ovipneumoniae]